MQPLDKKLFVVPVADNECDNNFTFAHDLPQLLDSNLEYPNDACWKPKECQRGQRILVIIPYRLGLTLIYAVLFILFESYCTPPMLWMQQKKIFRLLENTNRV